MKLKPMPLFSVLFMVLIATTIGVVEWINTNPSLIEFRVFECANHGSAFPISVIQSLEWLSEFPFKGNL